MIKAEKSTTDYSKNWKKDKHDKKKVILMLFILFCLPNSAMKGLATVVPGMYPAMVWYTRQTLAIKPTLTCYNGNRCNYSKVFNCNVYPRGAAPEDPEAYLFYGIDIERFPLPRDPNTIWGLFYDESPKLKPVFMHEKALNLFNFSMTFSRYSNVPKQIDLWLGYNLIHDKEFFINTSIKNSFLRDIAPIVFIQTNCFTLTEREAYVQALQKYIQVDSYGGCLHNKDLPPFISNSPADLLYGDMLMSFIARYKFQITIENAVCTDYVTEKLWRALQLGVVPIYYGSPLIRDWLPNNKSAILLEDFPTPKLLSEHLHYLLQNDTAYEEYLEHKTSGLISNQKVINYIKEKNQIDGACKGDDDYNFLCLICERIHDRKSTRVNMMTKKHYDCPIPKSALKLSVNWNNKWLKIIDNVKAKVDALYKEITDANKTRRSSDTNWYLLDEILHWST